ncbi:chitosanase [Actinoplanes sp. NPDC049265]|uniref:chitosanase n=1 Tax=Actinoplanes sp. NPDC049265 TaxID=3363902 RepID=UPI00371B9945
MGIRAGAVAFGTGVAALLTVPLVVTVTADAASDVLLSRSRAVLASAAQNPEVSATAAVDGDPTTRWAAPAVAGSQWLRVDLGAPVKIDRVRLTWDNAYATTYRVQVSSNASAWTDLASVRAGDGGTDDLKRLNGTGRYVRVLALRGTGAGYSLAEVQVYGPGPAPESRTIADPGWTVPAQAAPLTEPRPKELAQRLVSSAENSSLNWRGQYGYIEDIGDGRGYTGGLVGFTSGTSDMLEVVEEYSRRKPGNLLARYLPALRTVDGSDSHAGLDPGFPGAWKKAATDPVMQKVQEDERDRLYFDPAVTLARADGLRALGQFAYYDAAVMHGMSGLRGIREAAMRTAQPPKPGGDEITWLNAFLDARVRAMKTEEAHSDTTRVDTAQRLFLKAADLDLNTPLTWRVYGDSFSIR